MQSHRCLKLLIFTLLLAAVPTTGTAGEPGLYSTGIRLGTSFRSDDVDQGDFFIARKLPWSWTLSPNWNLDSTGELALSVIQGDDEEIMAGSISTDLFMTSPQHMLFFFTGVGAGVMEDEGVFADIDLGGPVFFLFHAGAGLRLTPWLSLSYRYAHQSNGSIYDKNPSLNLNMVEMRFHF
jgi:hypothetical protein